MSTVLDAALLSVSREIAIAGGFIVDASAGDRIIVESEHAGQSGRAGVIEEVLALEPPRFRVLWDDGHSAIFAPSSGVATIERIKKQRAKA